MKDHCTGNIKCDIASKCHYMTSKGHMTSKDHMSLLPASDVFSSLCFVVF